MTLSQRAKELGIRYFLVSYADLLGVSRAKLVPASAIDETATVGAPFAGFATWLDLTPADPDIFARPDPASLIPLPWKPEVGWLASDLWMNGQPLAQAPRNVLRRQVAQAAGLGYELRTGVECEFFLLTPDGGAVSDPWDRQVKPCYDQQALTRRYDLIAEICDSLLQLGWEPYQNDHEDANGQYEINWKYADALTTADRQMFFKYLVKTLAEARGFRATFMPKPFTGLTGNGCHTHISLWNRAGDRNLFADASDASGLSPLAYQFLGGVLNSAEALAAIVNPTINSYRRLHAPTTTSGATWSPNRISFSGNNRTHMVRIPDGGRIELRLVDGAANPYLSAAAILAAGLEGIARQRTAGDQHGFNVYTDSQQAATLRKLPETLLDALRCLERDPVLPEALGPEFTAGYLKLKQAEWREYNRQVSPWELQQTLDC
ncbi:MAG: type III glutamate--ammonia ligase [Planctomycetaceae bacterium]